MATRPRTLFAAYFFALSLAASIPLLIGLGIESVTHFYDRTSLDDELRRSEAAQVATEVEAFFDQVAKVLANIRVEPSSDRVVSLQRDAATEYQRLLWLFREVARVVLVDKNNVELIVLDRVSLDKIDGREPTQFGNLVSLARQSGKPQFQILQLPGQSGGQQSRLLVVSPTTDQTPFVLILEVDLRFVNDTLKKSRFSGGGYVFLTDSKGQLIAHPDAIVGTRRLVFPDATRSSGIAFVPNDLSFDTADRSKIQFSAHSFKTLPWISIAAQPEYSANAWVREAVTRTSVLLLVTLLGAGLFSWWSARRMARPISALTESARDLMLGQSINVQTQSGHRELRQLASQFSQMAERVTEAQGGLEQKVLEKTRDLAAANEELEVTSRHKSEFLAHMSHELRTPLNAVIGFSDLLKAQYFGPLNQKQSEYVRDINASGQHLLSLINDILDLAKVEAGRMELVLSDCHVATLVESCVSLVSERVSRSRQTLTTDVAPDVATWPLDERKLKQCLLNLLTNASKFTPVGGAIALRVWVSSNELVAAVSDNGVGIAAEDLPKLFSEFYQAKAADDASRVAAQREGTGLGLALTKGFLELHGGTISVTSVVGEGSTFTMRFPGLADGGVDKAALEHAENLGAAK